MFGADLFRDLLGTAIADDPSECERHDENSVWRASPDSFWGPPNEAS